MKNPCLRFLRSFAISLLALQAGLFAAAGTGSALAWELPEQSFAAEFGQESVEAIYAFTNKSDATITISSAEASCGCTVPSLEKKTYKPGESGELKAIFTIGSRQGRQHKTITVSSLSEGSNEPQIDKLQLEVDIPVPVTLKPRVRFWKIGAEATTQEVHITLHEALQMKISDIVRKDSEEEPAFNYTIETIRESQEYLLKITPINPKVKSRDVLYLTSKTDEKDILKSFPIYIYVR